MPHGFTMQRWHIRQLGGVLELERSETKRNPLLEPFATIKPETLAIPLLVIIVGASFGDYRRTIFRHS